MLTHGDDAVYPSALERPDETYSYFPPSVLRWARMVEAARIEERARVSLQQIYRAARVCRIRLQSIVRHMQDQRHCEDDLQDLRHTALDVSTASTRHKLQLQLPKTSHLINPKGPGDNDRSRLERSFNVATSIPFLAVGAHMLRTRTSEDREGRTYGWSMTAIGTVATLYHAASGDLRTILRKADYYTISLACMAMAESLHPQQRGPIEATAKLVSIAALPFRPTAVTACHAIRMELEYLRRLKHNARQKRQHCFHAVATSAGLGCFALENAAIKRGLHITHPLWHCLACYGLSSVPRPRSTDH